MIREADDCEKIEKAVFGYRNHGPGMEHNYLCSVCREESAVIEMWHGILQPCWGCQSKGWILKFKKPSWFYWVYFWRSRK